MLKPSIPEGMRDFSPEQVAKRTYIFETIKKVFVKYGFQPIETPTMEKLATLTGKYGEEGDRLIFKVLNNGLHEKKDKDKIKEDFNKILEKPLSLDSITERALRYDLTVPFARYVVMHQNDITFPFKRYQIQPVWRADRPQKGRYREFYQCDADVVGSDSLVYEAELIQIYDEVFKNFGLNVLIKINNRKILQGMAEAAGISDKFMDMTIAIDKLDKIGWTGVEKELQERGISEKSISVIDKLLKVKTLSDLEPFTTEGGNLEKGIAELREFHQYFDIKQPHNEVQFDITLARGLNYYTGCIVEVQAKDVKMGSIGGGGRYDDLTGVFGMKGVSGVGVSFGADRIYDCLQELDLFPKETAQNLKIIFVAFDVESHLFAFKALTKVREADINAEIYPEPAKMKKQMDYANKRNAPYVAIVGSEETAENMLSVKNMATGEQEKMSVENLIKKLSK
jgi:histidyl-tRNA synthetase